MPAHGYKNTMEEDDESFRHELGIVSVEAADGWKDVRAEIVATSLYETELQLSHKLDDELEKRRDRSGPFRRVVLENATISSSEEMIHLIAKGQNGHESMYMCVQTASDADSWVRKLRSAGDGKLFERSYRSSAGLLDCGLARSVPSSWQMTEFTRLLVRTKHEELRVIARSGRLERTGVRSLSWRLFLGSLPQDAPMSRWSEIIGEQRKRYRALKQKLLPKDVFEYFSVSRQSGYMRRHSNASALDESDSSEVESSEGEDEQNEEEYDDEAYNRRPTSPRRLSATTLMLEDSVLCSPMLYSKSVRSSIKADLAWAIYKDVLRTKGEIQYFRQETIQAIILRVLLVWSLEHSEVGYKQGMSELLAVILALLENEKVERPREDGDVLSDLLDANEIEADAYNLLSVVMVRMRQLYQPNRDSSQSRGNSSARLTRGTSYLSRKFRRIHSTLLKRIDPVLAEATETIGLEGHMYLLPWLRLLFVREFSIEKVWLVWDAIFSTSPDDFELCDFLCVALISAGTYREAVLSAKELSEVLLLLQKRMPVDVAEVIRNACKWSENSFPMG